MDLDRFAWLPDTKKPPGPDPGGVRPVGHAGENVSALQPRARTSHTPYSVGGRINRRVVAAVIVIVPKRRCVYALNITAPRVRLQAPTAAARNRIHPVPRNSPDPSISSIDPHTIRHIQRLAELHFINILAGQTRVTS